MRSWTMMISMAVVFAVVATLVFACGLGLTGVGVGMAIEGSVGAGLVFGLPIGLFVLYGGYLFGRAAVRTRRELRTHPPTDAVRRSRRSVIRFTLIGIAFQALVYIVLPLPVGVRVIAVIALALVAALRLGREFEPPKERYRTTPPG